MLRRAKKRATTVSDANKPHFTDPESRQTQVLGSKRSKDEEEDVLESLVIGSDQDLISNLDGRKEISEDENEKAKVRTISVKPRCL